MGMNEFTGMGLLNLQTWAFIEYHTPLRGDLNVQGVLRLSNLTVLSEMHLKHSWWCEWQTVTIQNHGVVHVVFQGTDSLARTHFFGVNKHIHLAWLSWSSSRTRFILSSLLKVCWDTSFSHVSARSVHQIETWISSNLLEVTGRFIFCQLLSRVNSLHFKEQVPCLNKAQLSFEGAGA